MRPTQTFIALILAMSSASSASAQSSDIVRPKSRKDIQGSVVLPASATCEQMVAFDVKLAESPGASPVTIIRTNVQWAGDTTVTEFEPAQPMPPFTRFFFHETPKSHKVSWAMGAAFFKAEWLALEAAAEYAEYYANALGASVREGSSGDMYFVSVNELHLMLVVDEKAVRVSCEHHPTQNLALQEALGWNE